MFTVITVAAGLLSGVALRAALGAGRGPGRVRAAAVLVALAVVLSVTCMVGRALLASTLGVAPAFTDWLLLFAAMAAGLAAAELLTRLDRAGRLPLDTAAGLRLPGAALIVLAAAVAIVPAYVATVSGITANPCGDFESEGTTLLAEAETAFPVRLRWSSSGGCAPIRATIEGVGSPGTRQGDRYGFHAGATGGRGEVTDPGPPAGDRLRSGTCVVTYALRLTDAAGHETAARARAITCPA